MKSGMLEIFWLCPQKVTFRVQSENGEVKNSENSETKENIFPRFFHSEFSICTIPETENSEIKTSEFFSEAFWSNSEIL